MYGEFATDPKVQMMSEADQRRFVMLLCLRCSNDDVTLHETEIAFQLRISNEEWATSKALFLAKGLIDGDCQPVAWNKRQFVSDSSRARVAAHRAKKKQEGNVTVTPPDTDTDTDKPIDGIAREGRFPMPLDGWGVDHKSFKAVAFKNSVPTSALTPEILAAFTSYWHARPEKEQSQAQWEFQLVQHLNNLIQRAKASGSTANGYARPENTAEGQTGRGPEANQRRPRQGSRSAVDQVRDAIAERKAREALASHDGQALAQDDGDVRPSLDGEFRRIS
jgi:hypothetical protein